MAPEIKMQYRQALSRYATGVCIVTTTDEHSRPVGLTCNSFCSVSLEPRIVSWSLQKGAASQAAFDFSKVFVVNVLAADQLLLAERFAKRSAHKFDELEFRTSLHGPVIAGAIAHFECSLQQSIVVGDHVLYLGLVEHFAEHAAEPLLFVNGKLRGDA
jgi:flavin reductase (DIM6/NTAB) family NADH-FMN oxidoreductase RutF